MESFDDNLLCGGEQYDDLVSDLESQLTINTQLSVLSPWHSTQGSLPQEFSPQDFAQINDTLEGYDQPLLGNLCTVSPFQLMINSTDSYHASISSSPRQSTLPISSPPHSPLASSQDEGAQEQNARTGQVRRRIGHPEWEAKKGLIKSLYLDDNYSLMATQDVLKSRYKFNASEGAFKRRFREWGFQKNIKKRKREASADVLQWTKNIPDTSSSNTELAPPPRKHARSTARNCTRITAEVPGNTDVDSNSPIQSTNISYMSLYGIPISLTQQPLYVNALIPLIERVSAAVRSYLSSSDTHPEVYDEETYSDLEYALTLFVARCRDQNNIAFTISCIDTDVLSRLIISLITDREWEDQTSIVLPFLDCEAKCLMACERYDESLSCITEIRSILLSTRGLDNVQWLRMIFSVDLFRAKIYLAQEKFDELDSLATSSCVELEALKLFRYESLKQLRYVKQQQAELTKMLLISRISALTLGNTQSRSRLLGENDLQLLIELLDRLSKDADEREFCLGLLAYLCCWYQRKRKTEHLRSVVQSMDIILDRIVDPEADIPSSRLVIYAMGAMISASYELREYDQITRLRDMQGRQQQARERLEQRNSLHEIGLDGAGPRAENNLYGMRLLPYNPENPLYPLYVVCRDYLWLAWPCVVLPWDKVEGVCCD